MNISTSNLLNSPSLPPAWWRHHKHTATGYCLVSALMAPLSPPQPTVAPWGCQWPGTGDRRTMYLYCSFCSLWHSQTSPHVSKWWQVLDKFLQISICSAMFVLSCLTGDGRKTLLLIYKICNRSTCGLSYQIKGPTTVNWLTILQLKPV